MTEIARNMPVSRSPRVVVLAYDGLCTFEFGITVEIFALPRPEMGEDWYRFAVAGLEPGPFQAMGGIRLIPEGGPEMLDSADMIIIPGWRGIDAPVPDSLCRALCQASARGCRILSICSGAFVLAAAGLLNGRRATTHWRYTTALQERYPQLTVVEDVLYIADSSIMTSAGSAAGIDLCLHVVREDYGEAAANSVARRLVMPPHRDGKQKQQLPRPVARRYESQRLGELFDYLHQTLAMPHSVTTLACRMGMSQRTFLRRFQECTGKTPSRWLLEARLQHAQSLLTTSRLSVENIAELTGFGSATTLRERFRKYVAMSPLQYRKTFTLSADLSTQSRVD